LKIYGAFRMKFFGLLTIGALITACAQPSPSSYPAASYPSSSSSETGTSSVILDAIEKQKIPLARFKQRTASKSIPENLQQIAQDYVGGMLKDPQSAQYRFDFMTTDGNSNAVCGAVNGKNAYGGYVGYKRFYVEIVNDRAVTGGLQGREGLELIAFCGATDLNNESRSKDEPLS
jgi:hypothetical protein